MQKYFVAQYTHICTIQRHSINFWIPHSINFHTLDYCFDFSSIVYITCVYKVRYAVLYSYIHSFMPIRNVQSRNIIIIIIVNGDSEGEICR